MREVKLNGKLVRVYDSIEDLPITRFHRYNKYLMVDAGVGSDINAFDSHIERVVAFIRKDDRENAAKELENLRQSVFLVLAGQNTTHLSFACLVESIDGAPCDDLSQEGLEKVLEQIGGASRKEVTEAYDSVKKKIDDELALYFPSVFDDVRTREYWDIVKRMTVARLQGITEGADNAEKVEKMREQLVTFTKPKVFAGAEGVEIRHDKDFETMCLMISKETGTDAKTMTVLAYYNAYEYLVKRQKRQNKAR